jgi:hypothetical protein
MYCRPHSPLTTAPRSGNSGINHISFAIASPFVRELAWSLVFLASVGDDAQCRLWFTISAD